MTEELLRMEGIRCMHGDVALIEDMDLTLRSGETMGILINNAYRRSYLASLLRGRLPLEAGRIYYRDAPVPPDAYPALCMRRIAYIGGQSDLIDSLSIAENLFLLRPASKTYLIRPGLLNRQAAQLLSQFQTHINPLAPVASLTPLQRMTVQLVKAYAGGVRIVLLNDLSRMLSPLEIGSLMECVSRLKAEGMGILLADAYWDVLTAYTDRLSVYDGGRVIWLMRREEYNTKILSLLLTGGRPAAFGPSTPPPASGTVALAFQRVYTASLREVSFAVHAGEIACILDMDGSGNDQIAALLQGECPLHHGEILIQNAPYTKRSIERALRLGLGILNENPTACELFPELSVMENLALPLASRMRGFFTSPRFLRSLRAQCDGLLPEEALGLPNLHGLSEELLLRIAYCRWQLMRPKAMVLKRPLSVADAPLGDIIHARINALAHRGCAVLILSSNMTEARRLAHTVYTLKDRRLCGDEASSS